MRGVARGGAERRGPGATAAGGPAPSSWRTVTANSPAGPPAAAAASAAAAGGPEAPEEDRRASALLRAASAAAHCVSILGARAAADPATGADAVAAAVGALLPLTLELSPALGLD